MDAELIGVNREQVFPVLIQIAESAYVRLAIMELSRGSWDPRHVVSGGISDLRQKMHSDEGLAELQSRLGVRSRNSKRFVVFAPGGAIFADVPPEPNGGPSDPYVDIWNVAQRIRNNLGGVLFHGARGDPSFAA
jgi:hypothetical protein